MQPHLLPEDLTKLVDGVEPEQVLKIPMGDLIVYLSDVADNLLARGYLNMILRDEAGRKFGFRIEEFENTPIAIRGQPRMRQLNASAIMGGRIKDGVVGVQHWDGFATRFDPETMEVLAQIYTH